MEKDYPMNYEEFKTRVIELYLFRVNSSDLENEKLFLKENPPCPHPFGGGGQHAENPANGAGFSVFIEEMNIILS